MKRTNLIGAALLVLACGAATNLYAQSAANLDQLLQQTREARAEEAKRNKAREAKFLSERDKQRELLARAKREKQAEEQRSDRLSKAFDVNEKKLQELETVRDARAGALGEMEGVVKQFAGDLTAVVQNSPVSIQIPGRDKFLSELAQTKSLPSIEQLEGLWYEMQREMTELGKVARFNAPVVKPDGSEVTMDVVRVGAFTAVNADGFLVHTTASERFSELTRQPAGRFVDMATDLHGASSGPVRMAIDPSRGQLLKVLVQAPSPRERIDQGGTVGYIIIGLALIGLLIAIFRFIALSALSAKMNSQQKNAGTPNENNPLGRILAVYQKDPNVDVETLELRMDEAVLKETPAIERGLATLKILAAIGPLLGLLGTVTGMIQTFQALALFGTGDPKLMADGISQALMTTVLGLVMAIPLVLLHSFLAGRAQGLIQTLEEESAGLIAEQAEKGHGHAG